VLDRVLTDGGVSIRPSWIDDVPTLIAGRDAEFERFLGPGSPDPRPVACIVVADQQVDAVVGWIDYDHDRYWLERCGDLDGNSYWKKRLDERPDWI
jgi:hypothetical protein